MCITEGTLIFADGKFDCLEGYQKDMVGIRYNCKSMGVYP
jgi:hypothetical protein